MLGNQAFINNFEVFKVPFDSLVMDDSLLAFIEEAGVAVMLCVFHQGHSQVPRCPLDNPSDCTGQIGIRHIWPISHPVLVSYGVLLGHTVTQISFCHLLLLSLDRDKCPHFVLEFIDKFITGFFIPLFLGSVDVLLEGLEEVAPLVHFPYKVPEQFGFVVEAFKEALGEDSRHHLDAFIVLV